MSQKSQNGADDVKKVSITIAGVLTFIVSLYLYRDLISFIVEKQLASGAWALSDALFIELVLGASAGVGAYYLVLQYLVSKGLLQQMTGIPVKGNVTPASNQDTAKATDTIADPIKAKLQASTYNMLAVVSPENEIHGVLSDFDVATKAGRTVNDLMTKQVISVSTKDSLFTAYNLITSAGLDSLPVYEEIERKKIFKGWITLREIMDALT